MRDKAWSILQSMPHDNDDVAFILKGPKITDFFYCIMGKNVCVVDGHAWCIANADRRTMQEVPNIVMKKITEMSGHNWEFLPAETLSDLVAEASLPASPEVRLLRRLHQMALTNNLWLPF